MKAIARFYQQYFFFLVPALLILAYFYITEPMQKQNATLHEELADQQQQLTWMQENAERIQSGNAPATISGKALTTVEALTRLEQMAKQHKIADKMNNLRPVNDKTVRLWLKGVEFNRFVPMLGDLMADDSLQIDNLNISADKPGKVDVDITLGLVGG